LHLKGITLPASPDSQMRPRILVHFQTVFSTKHYFFDEKSLVTCDHRIKIAKINKQKQQANKLALI